MWQSLVTIGPETSEISRRKKSKRIETSAVKYNGRRPASWRAAIMTENISISYSHHFVCLSVCLSVLFGLVTRWWHVIRSPARIVHMRLWRRSRPPQPFFPHYDEWRHQRRPASQTNSGSGPVIDECRRSPGRPYPDGARRPDPAGATVCN